MKIVLALLVLTLSGCSTYQTHLRTGCIWSCSDWENSTPVASAGSVPNNYVPSTGSTSRTYITPVGGYMAIRSGSTTTIVQTSRSK